MLLFLVPYYFSIILLGMDPKCLLTSTDLQTRRARCQHQLSFLFSFSFSYSCEFSVTVIVFQFLFLFQLVILHKNLHKCVKVKHKITSHYTCITVMMNLKYYFIFSMNSLLKAFSQPISLAYGRVIHRKFTLDIFQLMSFFYCIN